MNEQRLLWDDLRVIYAIAQAGSLSAAARRLGLSHATVFRRLGDIEDRLGVALFDRQRRGLTPTAAGEDVAAAAARVEVEVLGVERRVLGRDLRPSGTVRVTTTDTLFTGLLSPIFAAFRQTYPEIHLEVAVSNHLFNLSKREADVAVRPSQSPPEILVGRKIGTIAQAVYGHHDRFSPSPDEAALMEAEWIGPDERLAYRPLDRWMQERGLDKRCRYRIDTVMGILAAVRDGAGLAVLPCYLCAGDGRLLRASEPIPELATDLWLLTHADLRRVTRIRAFLDFVAEAVRGLRSRLAGA